jgi:capsular exopolysaccharide synthesis family protein
MDAIEKALEKARLRSDSLSPAYGGGGPTAEPPRAFDYEQTHVEPIQEKVLRRNRVIAGFPHDVHADIFRTLRVQVLKFLSGVGSTIGICSPNPGVGKSLVAANLAVSLALGIDHTALLVDADLRRPSLQNYFGLGPGPGLIDHLLHQAPLSDCLVNPGIERLVLLPAGKPVRNSSEILGSPKMLNLARELKSRYPDRFVIYDLPPLLAGDDALVFLPQLHSCILVIEERKTNAQELQRALDLLKGANLMGTILNKSQSSNAYSYYY